MFDTERFICEIELRPALYDVTSREYSNKSVKAKCWFDIGEAMFEDWHFMSPEQQDYKGRLSTGALTAVIL